MRTIVSAAAVFIAVLVAAPGTLSQPGGGVDDAPDGFELESNGFAEEFCANQDNLVDSPNSPQIPDDECNFEAALEEFIGPETVADGLGPIFNAAGCGECHIVPITGGSSQIMERRAGRFQNGVFTDHPGGSLIQDRALFGFATQETVIQSATNVVAFRSSLSILGNGFVEAVSNTTLDNIADRQPSSQRGQVINVPVLERPGTNRIGRFGHKGQQASLVSFSADAYLNEMGITSPLQPVENTSNGNPIIDPVPGEDDDPQVFDDEGVDVELFALFMRSTLVPPRASNKNAPNVRDGEDTFDDIGCDVCHTPSMVTVSTNTPINGGAFKVPSTLANKRIEPFSDFLLHDIGTGDGIVQNGGLSTRNKIRTPALWGLRVRGRFMHDARSFSLEDAIARHENQASAARNSFNALSSSKKANLLAFLKSL